MPDKKFAIDLAYRPRLADLKPLTSTTPLLEPQALAAPRTTPASDLKNAPAMPRTSSVISSCPGRLPTRSLRLMSIL